MATILCVTSELPGMLYAGVELARRLAADGHRLTYASYAGARRTVERQGLEFVELAAGAHQAFLAADAEAGVWRRLRRLRRRREQALAAVVDDDLAAALRRLEPDLTLIDGEMHEQVIATAARGVPVALLNAFVSIWRRPGLPPPHHLARPGAGWKGTTIGTWLLWQALRVGKRRRAWTQKLRHVGCDRLSLLRRLARDRGFDFRRETDAGQWLIPFTYRRLPVLSLHAREFEFPHRPPARVRYVGPMVLEDRGEEAPAAGRAELERIFARCRGHRRALIYAGFGSFFSTDLGFVRRIVDAVAERGDRELVISLGGRIDPADLGRLPGNVHAFGWLPQLEVLRHAEVAVTHGGIHTVDECVLCGVPMLVYCGFATDMAGITSRVVHHGLGIAGDRRRDGPRTIGGHLDRLLREPGFRANVERLRARYAAYAADRVAERAVAELLARRPGSGR